MRAWLPVAAVLVVLPMLLPPVSVEAREVPPAEPPVRCVVLPRPVKGKPLYHPYRAIKPCPARLGEGWRK